MFTHAIVIYVKISKNSKAIQLVFLSFLAFFPSHYNAINFKCFLDYYHTLQFVCCVAQYTTTFIIHFVLLSCTKSHCSRTVSS